MHCRLVHTYQQHIKGSWMLHLQVARTSCANERHNSRSKDIKAFLHANHIFTYLQHADYALENKTECLFTLNNICHCGCRPGCVPTGDRWLPSCNQIFEMAELWCMMSGIWTASKAQHKPAYLYGYLDDRFVVLFHWKGALQDFFHNPNGTHEY